MRRLSLIALLLPALASAQNGVYRNASGAEAHWTINPNHTLLWEGQPYLPFGLRIGASEAEIKAAKSSGVLDVVVDCPPTPAIMKGAVDHLEAQGLRYILSISALAPTARGALIEPQGNRFTGITAKRTLEFKIPGAEEALVVLAVRRDGTVQKSTRVKGNNGAFSVEVNPPNDLEHVALIFPITSSLAQLGAWESFDEHRDDLLTSLKRAGLGKGLRGILNPLGSFAARTGPRSFVPSGKLFRFEFEAFLKQTYRNPETAMRSWAMSGGVEQRTFAQLARMVPLWTSARGLSTLWDPADDKLYPCEMRRSTIWRDLDTVLSSAESRRTERLVASIKKIANVPVLQEWVGWSPVYEGAPHGLDGIAARTSGATPSSLAETASRAASSLLRWTRPGWLIATQVDMSGIPDAAAQVPSVVEDLLSLGMRGAFMRSQENDLRSAIVQISGSKGQDSSLAQWSPKPLFYPETATNPASTMRLPGGTWWLPAPLAGNRVDLGTLFSAYRLEGSDGTTIAIWSRVGRLRVKLHMATPSRARFQALDGSNPDPKLGRDGVDVNLTEIPLIVSGIDEIPVPDLAFKEMVGRFDAMLLDSERRQADTTEERFLFKDQLNGFARNPGGNFAQMQTILQKLGLKLARYLWIEAETTRESNFSEIQAVPGASANNALGLRTQLATSEGDYKADYILQPRTDEEVECWIAARIAKTDRELVRLAIGGQDLAIEGEPVSEYGNGFAWYSLGRTRMGRAQTKITLKVRAPEGAEMAFDAILFYPGSFRPQGTRMPDPIVFPPVTLKK